jgi:hypothetical protein
MQKNLGFKGFYNTAASSFWLGQDFDVSFKENNNVDYTKLAAAQRAIGNFVNIVTGKQIPVVFQSNDNSYTDGERVVIGTKLEDKNFDPAVGLALHEGSHIAFTDFSLFAGATRLSNSPFANAIRLRGMDPNMDMTEEDFAVIKDLLNWIEDRRIDYKVYTNAPGYRVYYEAMYDKYFNDKIIDKALLAGEKCEENMDCYMFHIINFTNPNRQLDTLKDLRNIWNLIDLKSISRLKTTTDALEVACDVYKILKAAIKDAEAEQEVKMNKAGGNFSGEEGPDGDGEASDSGDPIGADQPGDIKTSQLSDKELAKLEKAIEAQREFIKGNAKKTGKLSKQDKQLVDAIKESGTETRDVATGPKGDECPVTTVVIKKLTPAIIDNLPELFQHHSSAVLQENLSISSDNYRTRYIKAMDDAVQQGILLGRRLGSKLQLRNSDRSLKSTRLTAGKIDRRLVSQLGYENVNVFHRIVTDRYKNYFIHISIDASGSMAGNKFHQAILSAVAIAQAASMTTGIRVQISLRGTDNLNSSREKCVTMYAYDSAHDKMNKIKTYFKFLSTFGCTPEGIAFKSIEKDLKADAKGDELIFINYSDGEPTPVSGGHHQYNGIEFTRRIVNLFRESGINVISYFIKTEHYGGSSKENFHIMYGPDAKFIDPSDMRDIAKTMNSKFLEMVK